MQWVKMTPDQVAMLVGDREKIAATNNGQLHFRDGDEFRTWYAQWKQESGDSFSDYSTIL